jgi:hypothetical protein
MKKSIALSICLVLFANCAKEEPTVRINFSHISLASCNWLVDEDGWHLKIYSYIRIDSSGAFQVARRSSPSDTLQYFKGVIPPTADSVLNKLSALTQDTSFVEQALKRIDIYDAPIHCLITERGDNPPIIVEYVPLLYPDESKQACRLLDSLAQSGRGAPTKPFNFKSSTELIVRFDNMRKFHLPESEMKMLRVVTD